MAPSILRAGCVLSLGLALAGCQPPDQGPATELTIFNTNDIHSYMHGPKTDPFGLGGVARLSTILHALRARTPTSLTLDAGDWSEGRWYFDIDTGANMLRLLDQLGYDAAALGNHDFLVGPDRMIETIQAARVSFPVLAANIDVGTYANPNGLRSAVPPYTIKTIGGLKVGIIGATTYSVIYASYLDPATITEPVQALAAVARALRPQVDVLLVVSHNDFSENETIAEKVPGVDALISGHTHLKTPVATLVKGASGKLIPVVETGCWARFLGDLKLNYYAKSKTVEFKSFVLHPVDSSLDEDPAVSALIQTQEAKLAQQYGVDPMATLVDSDAELDQSDVQETPLGNLIVKAYRATTAADLSLEETSFGGVSVAEGPVTWFDLHDVMPHLYNPATGKEWTLHLWKATGRDLMVLFDAFRLTTGLMPGQSPIGWLDVDNINMVWDPTATQGSSPGLPLVSSVSIAGKPLDVSATYTVALADGMLRGMEIVDGMLNLGIDLSRVQDTGIEAWRSIAEYARAAGKLTLDDLRIGKTSQASGADLAVHSYGIQALPDTGLSVEVENHGTLASNPGLLQCWYGIENDPVDFDTPSQDWKSLSTVPLPTIQPQTLMKFPVSFGALTGRIPAGLLPVRCQVSAPGEVYPDNNVSERVLTIGGGARR